jgi:glucose/arabinose dehydrogenase
MPPQGLPDPTGYTWRPVAGGLQKPLGLATAADGTGRLFIVEQAGRIQVVQDGQLLPQTYLDITDRVGSRGNEQGLLGLAFHPHYAQNGFFYVNYTDLNGDTVIARFQVSADDPNRADPGSEKRLLSVKQPFPNHNGGSVVFGPDGYLYLGLGDGGSAGDPLGNGQSLDTLLGKILRIDVDNGDPYAIPPDNPFAGGGGRAEIWAYGLRNPWRFSFDRLTGDLYIGDVGQNQVEEIDFLPANSPGGSNFGWNFFEGSSAYQGAPPPGLLTIPPVTEYSHALGCSVTGGVVYRGSRLPEWQGIYLFGDYCSGSVWGLTRDAQGSWLSKILFERVGQITSFGQDEQREVYLVDQGGVVYVLDAK